MYINNENFIIKEIPRFIPESSKHIEWWRDEKRKCIEGTWVSGKYMPGVTFFYVNFWYIKLKKSEFSKNEITSRPMLRDLEWEKGYLYIEARGFSGFSLDKEYTCNDFYKPEVREVNEGLEIIPKNNLIYVHPREYLRKIHKTNLGKPIYENEAKNIVDIESRGGGKSYFAAAVAGHNFLFDGATDYDDYIKAKQNKTLYSSETLIAAIDTKYTSPLINKFWLGISELPGKQEYNGRKFASPLYLEHKGSLSKSNDYIEAIREVKYGNNWVEEGSRSKVHHRSFRDNPQAGNGIRPNLIFLEEVGFMGNLEDALGSLRDCTMNGTFKFGTIWMFGTGGDMEGGSTQAVKNVFYNPEENDCLVFEDEYENKGKIGYFVPAHMTFNDCKDSEGITDKEKAKKKIKRQRDKVKDSPKAFIKELENKPEKPSEAFLTSDSNMFPVRDCEDRLAELETTKSILDGTWQGRLTIDEEGNVKYKLSEDRVIFDFPLKDKLNTKGAVHIFEHPYDEGGRPPKGLYLAGFDTIDDDGISGSLMSIWVANTLTNRIVAEYTGRHNLAEEGFEIVRRLILYYNAECNYENQKKGFYAYMDKKNCNHMLADTPKILKDVDNLTIHDTGNNKSKGTNATEKINIYARSCFKHWLLKNAYTTTGDADYNNIKTIKSPALLKEIINWNPKGNFDRISGIGMLMILMEDKYKISVGRSFEEEEEEKDGYFERHWNQNSYIDHKFPTYNNEN